MPTTRRRRSLLLAGAVVAWIVVAEPTPVSAGCGDAPGPGVDWSGCSFPFADLQDVDLAGADLRGIDLSYAVLFRANMQGADLRGANLRDAFPIAADLSGANLSDADLSDADLVGADLTGAVLRRTILARSDVDLSSIADASFVGADLTAADFTNVSGADQATFALPPEAAADEAITWQDRDVRIDVAANDDQADVNRFAAAGVELVDPPSRGVFDPTTLVYRPSPGATGTDRFTYRLLHRLEWDNLPAGVVRDYRSRVVEVVIEIVPVVRVGPPYGGASGEEGEIVRLYVALLRRVPDSGGFDYWVGQRRNGQSLEAIAAFFQSSSEFLADNASLGDAEFVTLLYHNVLERTPDSAGLAFWVDLLQRGAVTRAAVTLAFSESPEFLRLTGTS